MHTDFRKTFISLALIVPLVVVGNPRLIRCQRVSVTDRLRPRTVKRALNKTQALMVLV